MKNFILTTILVTTILFFTQQAKAQWVVKHQSSIISNVLVNYTSVINNKVYLVGTPSGVNNYVYEYNAITNNYTQKTISTIGLGSVSFTLDNKMFSVDVGANSNATRAYDPVTDSWNNMDAGNSFTTILTNIYPPSNYGLIINSSIFTFSINNDAYVGGITMIDLATNTQFISPYLFKYNSITDNYTPVIINNMPSLYNILEPTTFVVNQKAYVTGTLTDPVTSSGGSGLFEIDLSSNNLIQKTFCTSCNEIRHTNFVLNNKVYFNKRMDWSYCEKNVPILIYDPVTDNWSMGDSIMQTDTANVGLGFSVNNKGYFGYGTKWSGPSCQTAQGHSILYEYDMPTFIDNNETNLMENIKVYPNPSDGNFTVELKNLKSTEVKISMYDIFGKEIYMLNTSLDISKDYNKINLSDIPSGLYFISIISNNDNITEKILVE